MHIKIQKIQKKGKKIKKNVNANKAHQITNFENGRQSTPEYDNYRSH